MRGNWKSRLLWCGLTILALICIKSNQVVWVMALWLCNGCLWSYWINVPLQNFISFHITLLRLLRHYQETKAKQEEQKWPQAFSFSPNSSVTNIPVWVSDSVDTQEHENELEWTRHRLATIELKVLYLMSNSSDHYVRNTLFVNSFIHSFTTCKE